MKTSTRLILPLRTLEDPVNLLPRDTQADFPKISDRLQPTRVESGMSTAARVPDDIWDLVIDSCDAESFQKELPRQCCRLDTLRACALTCRRWLPRSQFNLYSTVSFTAYAQVDMFLSTINARPDLADYTHTLLMRHYHRSHAYRQTTEYIPIARRELVRKLRNVQTLFVDMAIWASYPPGYAREVARYPVTELHIGIEARQSPTSLHRFVQAFRNLERLSIAAPKLQSDIPTDPAQLCTKVSIAISLKNLCTSLRVLDVNIPALMYMAHLGKHLLSAPVVDLVIRWEGRPWGALYPIPFMLPPRFTFPLQLDRLERLTLVDTLRPDIGYKEASETATPQAWSVDAVLLTHMRQHGTLHTITLRSKRSARAPMTLLPAPLCLPLVFRPKLVQAMLDLPALQLLLVDLEDIRAASRVHGWREREILSYLPPQLREIAQILLPPNNPFDDSMSIEHTKPWGDNDVQFYTAC
ncbi:hypothetical protein OH77DRAFT_354465 [Trametes cingulata]|nr:hypothetical protein OH77DRAFT_354465 [Trametes cingulata]